MLWVKKWIHTLHGLRLDALMETRQVATPIEVDDMPQRIAIGPGAQANHALVRPSPLAWKRRRRQEQFEKIGFRGPCPLGPFSPPLGKPWLQSALTRN